LKEKAVRSYAQYRSASLPARDNPQPSLFSSSSDTDGVEDELAIFGGQTRVLARKTKTKHSSTDSSPSPTTSAGGSVSPHSATSPLEPSHLTTALPTNVHPSLVEYLGSYPLEAGYDSASLTNPQNNDGQQMSFEQSVNVPGSSDNNSAANPPSGKQMGEMFSSFMGYLANRSISNVTVALPVPESISDPCGSVQLNTRQNWGGPMEGTTPRFPQADESFGWRPPFDPQANLSHQSQPSNLRILSSPTTTSINMRSPSSNTVTLQSSNPQTRYIPANDASDQSFTDYDAYAGSMGYTQYAPAPTDPGGPMVELGLMTESEIDSGWFSFMQDCGISMDSPPRNSTSL
jgi:hypothetical protein